MPQQLESGLSDTILLDNVSLTNLGVYMLFEEIGEESILNLCDYLIKGNLILDSKDAITLMLNSPGGCVFDGWAAIDVMNSSRIDIQTVAMGCIASMAVLIFIAGTKGKRIMTPNSYVMTHQFSASIYGKEHELVASRKCHDIMSKQIVNHFIDNTKMNEKQIRQILLGPSDTWLTPEECLKFGICDKISEPWPNSEIKKSTKKTSRNRKA
jgi:ATP-dependent Clp protease, protease subunit